MLLRLLYKTIMLKKQYILTLILYSVFSFPTKSDMVNNAHSDKNILNNKTPFTFYSLGNVNVNNVNIELNTDAIILNMIIQQLPEYDITLKQTSFDLAFQKITTSKNICLRNLMQTPERETFFEFSRPINIFLGFRLYFSPDVDVERINKIKHLSISDIIKHDKKMTLGIEDGRAYGEKLTNIIQELPEQNKFLRHESDGENLMIAMLLKGRFDMLIESPETMDFKVKKLEPTTVLTSISPINAEPVLYGRLACSKSVESIQLIEKINEILEKTYPTKAFLNAHLMSLEKPSHDIFNAIYKDFIGNNVQ